LEWGVKSTKTKHNLLLPEVPVHRKHQRAMALVFPPASSNQSPSTCSASLLLPPTSPAASFPLRGQLHSRMWESLFLPFLKKKRKRKNPEAIQGQVWRCTSIITALKMCRQESSSSRPAWAQRETFSQNKRKEAMECVCVGGGSVYRDLSREIGWCAYGSWQV
jgi:hypothetical protein